MATKYIIVQDYDGAIKVRKKGWFFSPFLMDANKYTRTFTSTEVAEQAVKNLVIQEREHKARKLAALQKRGVCHVYNSANDEDFSVPVSFQVLHDGSLDYHPYYVEELKLLGWVKVLYKPSGSSTDDKPKLRKFSSVEEARTFIMEQVRKDQDAYDKIRRARVIKVIDTANFDVGETA